MIVRAVASESPNRTTLGFEVIRSPTRIQRFLW
jgi:hypothetical protein